jgi:hypothetical protein
MKESKIHVSNVTDFWFERIQPLISGCDGYQSRVQNVVGGGWSAGLIGYAVPQVSAETLEAAKQWGEKKKNISLENT